MVRGSSSPSNGRTRALVACGAAEQRCSSEAAVVFELWADSLNHAPLCVRLLPHVKLDAATFAGLPCSAWCHRPPPLRPAHSTSGLPDGSERAGYCSTIFVPCCRLSEWAAPFPARGSSARARTATNSAHDACNRSAHRASLGLKSAASALHVARLQLRACMHFLHACTTEHVPRVSWHSVR